MTSLEAGSPIGTNEGTTVSQEDVRKVPRHSAPQSRMGDLYEPAAQAKAGVVMDRST